MPTVAELSAPFANFMLGPRPGPDVCARCFDLTDGCGQCSACARNWRFLEAMVPISYSVSDGQLHHALASYKRLAGVSARQLTLGLAAVLWRHLACHERCLARAAGVDAFTLVTTVPSSSPDRDAAHRLRELAGLVTPLRGRYERVLRRSAAPAASHQLCVDKYAPLRDLTGHAVLLIDDTWTRGANAQSAAAALKAAGAETVAAVVIGRYVNRSWRHNQRHLRELAQPFDWERCALCADPPRPS